MNGLTNLPRRRDAIGRFRGEPAPDPELVRPDYEANVLSLPDVALKHGTNLTAIHRMAVRLGWRPRSPHRIDPADLINRMFAAIDTQMRELEVTQMKTQGAQAGVLAKLVSTLDKLIEIKDAEARRPKDQRRPSRQVVQLRAKIAERIAELNDD
jgi:hypothetical protein